MDLSKQKCEPCEGGRKPMARAEAETMLEENLQDWSLNVQTTTISKRFKFKDFKEALVFVNRVGELAEREGHHPDIHLTDYNQVLIVLSTHTIGGLSKNDFIMAIKIDLLINRNAF